MRIYLLIITAVLLFSSCGGKKNEAKTPAKAATVTVPPTEPEKAGVKDVTDFYGGVCNFSTGINENNKRKYARLEIGNSAVLDSAASITALNIANMALMFYKDLGAERNKFDEIQAMIMFSNAQNVEKTYPVSLLAMVLDKSRIVDNVVEALKAQQYSTLDTLLDDQNGINHYDKKKLIASIAKTDPGIGKIKSFVRFGFIMIKADNGKDVLHIGGMMVRDHKNNEFSVDIDPEATTNKAIFINYKL